MGTRPKRLTVKTRRSGEWPKNITIRILLGLKLCIEFRPQYPGSIHYSFAALPGERPGVWGVFYVDLGRRDVHHDGRVCCVCCSLYRGLAVVGVTLLEGGNNVAS